MNSVRHNTSSKTMDEVRCNTSTSARYTLEKVKEFVLGKSFRCASTRCELTYFNESYTCRRDIDRRDESVTPRRRDQNLRELDGYGNCLPSKLKKRKLKKMRKQVEKLKIIERVAANKEKRLEVFSSHGYEDPEPYTNVFNSGLVFIEKKDYNQGPIPESASFIFEKLSSQFLTQIYSPSKVAMPLFDNDRVETVSWKP